MPAKLRLAEEDPLAAIEGMSGAAYSRLKAEGIVQLRQFAFKSADLLISLTGASEREIEEWQADAKAILAEQRKAQK